MTDLAESPLRPQQLLVLDPRQPGWPAALGQAGADTAVLLLDPELDGLQQVVEVAAGYAPLRAVHLPEHGAPGHVVLGGTVLDAGGLPQLRTGLVELAGSLATEGVLRLGGEPGRGVPGRRLAELLAEATGRTVLSTRPMPALVAHAGAEPRGHWSQPAAA